MQCRYENHVRTNGNIMLRNGQAIKSIAFSIIVKFTMITLNTLNLTLSMSPLTSDSYFYTQLQPW